MESSKKLTFDANTMVTTVGANSLNVETVVSQPCSDQADLMDDGLDYVFDQAKFEENLSSSSSKSSSPRKHRRISSPKREVQLVVKGDESRPSMTEVSSHRNTLANCKAGSSADSIQRRSHPLESTDGVHCHRNSRDQRRQQTTVPRSQPISTPVEEEWVLVKRIHLTKKERAQRHCARAARAREVIRKAQESKSIKGSSRKVWIQEPAQNLLQGPACGRDSRGCLGQKAFIRDSASCLTSR